MYNYSTRIENEVNSFATASMLLNQVSGFSGSFVRSSKDEDCNKATDGFWNGYPIAIRDRTMTVQQFAKYKNDFTVRATGELEKLLSNDVKAIVYIRRTASHQLLGYSVISVSRLREYLSDFDTTKDNWWKATGGIVSLINYSNEQEPFYAINTQKLKSILLINK